MPNITITRNRGVYAKMRALKIIVDGQYVASIKQGESLTIAVPSHEFEMYGKMDWARTNILTVKRARNGDQFGFISWITLNFLRNLGYPTMPVHLEQVPSDFIKKS